MITTRIGACLLAATLVVGACGGDDDDTSNVTVPADPSTTTSTTAATTTTTEDPKAAIEQAFYDQWDAFVTILENPDPANPLIDKFFTGASREALLDSVSTFLKEGKAARRPEDPQNFAPSVVSVEMVSSTEAVLYECTVDGIAVVDVETGAVLDDDVETYSLRNQFKWESGEWKLADTREPRSGEPSCDNA